MSTSPTPKHTVFIKKAMWLMLSSILTACGSVAPTEDPVGVPTQLNDVKVMNVTLNKPIEARDMSGDVRTWAKAYLVQMGIPEIPITSMSMDLYLGDYRVPEYGGMEDGLYFWVYDPDQLESFNGKEVSYKYQGGKRTPIGTLSFDPVDELPTVAQDEVF